MLVSSSLAFPTNFVVSIVLSHWYRDCAAASKPAEVGLSPTWGTKGRVQVRILFENGLHIKVCPFGV